MNTGRRISSVLIAGILAVLSGCVSHGGKEGASVAAAPRSPISPSALDLVDPPDAPRHTARGSVALPDVIELPASYRWVLLNGRPALVRETDPRKITMGGGMLLVAGDVSRGEVAMQPALMPQEIAAELTRNRALQKQMIEAFADVNNQVASLLRETRAMQQRNAELVKQLAQVTEYARQLESKVQTQGSNEPKK